MHPHIHTPTNPSTVLLAKRVAYILIAYVFLVRFSIICWETIDSARKTTQTVEKWKGLLSLVGAMVKGFATIFKVIGKRVKSKLSFNEIVRFKFNIKKFSA